MTARHLHFARADLLAMPFDEMIGVWWPEVQSIAREEREAHHAHHPG